MTERATVLSPEALDFAPSLLVLRTTINQLKGKVTMLFITHALPKALLVDEVVRIGEKLALVADENSGRNE